MRVSGESYLYLYPQMYLYLYTSLKVTQRTICLLMSLLHDVHHSLSCPHVDGYPAETGENLLRWLLKHPKYSTPALESPFRLHKTICSSHCLQNKVQDCQPMTPALIFILFLPHSELRFNRLLLLHLHLTLLSFFEQPTPLSSPFPTIQVFTKSPFTLRNTNPMQNFLFNHCSSSVFTSTLKVQQEQEYVSLIVVFQYLIFHR